MNRDRAEQQLSPWDPQDKTASVLPSFTQFYPVLRHVLLPPGFAHTQSAKIQKNCKNESEMLSYIWALLLF